MLRKVFMFIAGCTAVFTLASCPAPISQAILNNVTDELSPVIVILSPEDGSYCAKSVIVTGTVSDLSSGTDAPGQVTALRYEILSSTSGGEISIDEDGSFSFEFSTVNYGSNFVVRVLAEDWNGNIGEASLNLQKLDGNDIPSFTVVPGAGRATLSWNEVPNTSSYELYYTGGTASGITSPYTLESLDNGSMYVFQLCATSSQDGGESSWSDSLGTIPLSPGSLEPAVISETSQLTVRWPEIPGTSAFEVWRSREESGSYLQISNQLLGNEFTDRQISDSGGYFYRIRPVLEGCLLSSPGYGAPAAFPAAPEIAGTVSTAATTYGTAVSGDYLFIADGAKGLKIMNISEPSAPVLVRTVELGEADGQYAFNVEVAGGYAYVANGYEGLQIVDIDPASEASVVRQVKKASGLQSARDVAVDTVSGFAYVADNYLGLVIVDISVIASAYIYKEVAVTNAEAADISGNYAYVAGSAGVSVIDLIDPAAPIGAAVDNTILIANSKDVDIVENTLYIAADTSGLRLVNITDPTAPSVIDTIDTPQNALGVTVSGGFAYVADETSGLQIINVALTRSGTLYPYIKTAIDTNHARCSAIKGDYLYLADSTGGTRVINISNPSLAEAVTVLPAAGDAYGIEVRGNYAYLADSAGLSIMDISDPESPSLVKSVSTPGTARDIALIGGYACIADWSEGVQIIDISDPGAAEIVKSLATDDWADNIRVQGDYAYVGVRASGVQIFDISEPESAFSVKTVDTDGTVQEIAISGSYLFAADSSSGVQVIDIEVPSAARVVNTFFDPAELIYGTAVSAGIYGRYLFVGVTLVTDNDPDIVVEQNSVLVFDVSDPEGVDGVEKAIPIYWLTGGRKPVVSGGYLYLSSSNYGLQIIDVSSLIKAGYVGMVKTTDLSVMDAAVVGDYVFAAASGVSDGLQVIDLRPW